ncbi:glutathione S-transferase family protein [Shewanella gelidii]|uniref:Glutathione-dependent reductase n=1 Tax=Shewanella gelidii TaxID=1642821 RepID=A0A917JRI4_9GAMM|nr:glutathione S-transferase family protein [Shewanella gelidii]MCL1099093.1 glutathione S-transferase family protein [Shewanella gelidii]GGI81881.1 glutathione-dependent reductase [Shewanella gelidii]
MGLLVDGQWVDEWYDTKANQGEFKRQQSRFRHQISKEGNDTSSPYIAEADRYHLYVSLACPWAHRTLIFRQLKQLQPIISVSVVQPKMLDNGWEFSPQSEQSPYKDDIYGHDYLYQLYLQAAPDYQGRVTVPVLWDKQTQTIVNNESSDIIRIMNSTFNHLTGNQNDYYPQALRGEIDAINQRVYDTINNGVYRAGFATSQSAYEQAFDALFASLDWLEQRLATQRYLIGNQITEADWRLFTTLVRFDAVYFGHFKCNRQQLLDYHHLSQYLRDLYQQPGIAATVDLDYSKLHYYGSHKTINPTGVIPKGPLLDFNAPHQRDHWETLEPK